MKKGGSECPLLSWADHHSSQEEKEKRKGGNLTDCIFEPMRSSRIPKRKKEVLFMRASPPDLKIGGRPFWAVL